MIIDYNDIPNLILNPKNTALIKQAVKNKKRADLHITGKGLDKFLEKIDGVENEDYISLKKKLTNQITVAIYEQTLTPVNRIFSSKGGSITIEIKDESAKAEYKRILNSNYFLGLNINEYIEKIWAKYSIWCDPIGCVLFIPETDEITKQQKLKLRYIQVEENNYINYHDIVFSSFDKIEYLIIDEGRDDKNNKIYTLIDDEKYIQIRQIENSNDISIIPETLIINTFGYVPACLNSSRIDKSTIKSYSSYSYESLFIADNYLNDYSDFRIYKKKIGIPRIWEFKVPCEKCGGVGEVQSTYNNIPTIRVCESCNGSGYDTERSLSDIFRLNILKKDFQGYIPPTGAVTLPVDIQQEMIKELAEMHVEIYNTIWGQGSYVDKERKNTTAFEVSVRNEEKQSKLSEIDRNLSAFKEKIYNIIGKFYFPEKFERVIVRPANQFILNSATEALQLYFEAKNDKASNNTLNELYNDYLYSKYENDILQYERQLKLMLVNPSPHHEINEVSNILSPIELLIKKNFDRYIWNYEKEFGKIELEDNPVDKIYLQLTKYAQNDFNTQQENRSGNDDGLNSDVQQSNADFE